MFLFNLNSLAPRHQIQQGEALKWLSWIHAQNSDAKSPELFTKLFSRFGCSPERIQTRYYEHDQYGDYSEEGARLFSGFPISQRMSFFEKVSDQRMNEFYETEQKAPELLIHVSCTGYVSPSAAQKVAVSKGWHQSTRISHAYHMGCYASLPAIRQATDHLSGSRSANGGRVDIGHNELCTLHLNPTLHSPEQMVVQSLFADGHIRYSLAKSAPAENCLEILAVQEELIPNSMEAMTWRVSEKGFEMTLAREVPEFIQGSIQQSLDRLGREADVTKEEMNSAIFAIHPGGPRIIDLLSDLLRLRVEQSEASRQVLLNHGNMSSATLPHVWKRILENPELPDGAVIISFAFGPGLTIYSSVMRLNKYVAS